MTSLNLNSTLLLTYSCQLNPAGGVGALMAMHDAVALAKWMAKWTSTMDRLIVSDLENVSISTGPSAILSYMRPLNLIEYSPRQDKVIGILSA